MIVNGKENAYNWIVMKENNSFMDHCIASIIIHKAENSRKKYAARNNGGARALDRF